MKNKSKIIHSFYIAILFIVGTISVIFVGLNGMDYYLTPLVEKPYHPDYEMWKPTGFYGHGLGFLGTTMILVGVIIYSSRKRLKVFSNFGNINYWLEFHIFLCIVGPIFVLYHTTFKFGGIVAVSFFSMTSVVLSGFIGRYFYVQIPKNIKGQELTLDELDNENTNLSQKLIEIHSIDAEILSVIDSTFLDIKNKSNDFIYLLKEIFLKKFHRKKILNKIQKHLYEVNVSKNDIKKIISLANKKIVLVQGIAMLEFSKKVFHYWHVVHLPFSIVMFLILAIHITVAFLFGYTWIF